MCIMTLKKHNRSCSCQCEGQVISGLTLAYNDAQWKGCRIRNDRTFVFAKQRRVNVLGYAEDRQGYVNKCGTGCSRLRRQFHALKIDIKYNPVKMSGGNTSSTVDVSSLTIFKNNSHNFSATSATITTDAVPLSVQGNKFRFAAPRPEIYAILNRLFISSQAHTSDILPCNLSRPHNE